jgi:ZIP family zinc transporter
MIEAALWGMLSASSLLMGALVALRLRPSNRFVGIALGFGAGALISAVAYELVEEAFDVAKGTGVPAIGVTLGALIFFAGDWYIDRRGGDHRKRAGDEGEESGSAGGIVLGTVLDGIPESIVIGGSLVIGGGVSVAMVAAAFLSNLPESLGATSGLQRSGLPVRRIVAMWMGIVLVSGASAALGYQLLEDASPRLGAFFQAFAAGSILTMLADSMMPEAYREGGKLVGLATVIGFALALWVSSLG